ncbi:MAG: class II aldolase/adducin family protein [Burkholderiales bacterium]|nr:class II aldolase/adducin family protein [Burkholderiales bacterium]
MSKRQPGPMDEAALREVMIAALVEIDARGLNRGSSGNLSHRFDEGMLITPTGMGAGEIAADDLVWLGFDGSVRGRLKPSSEWHFHAALYRARPELNAVVHTHASHATALACLRRELPAFHYMVAIAGGDNVRCAPYRLFGTQALSDEVVRAMHERRACLLATHGAVSAGATLREAMKVMIELDSLCQSYLAALAVGEPAILDAAEMAEVIAKFRGYGQGPVAADGG